MGTDELLIDRDADVVTVTFNRVERHNAFTTAMYDALQALIHDLPSDPQARVLVLRGAGGKAFAAGNDIREFTSLETGDDVVRYEARVQDLVAALAALPQVSVAAIDGLCVGGGLAVATGCDLRIATAGSRFGYPIARSLGNALSRTLLQRCVGVFGDSLTRQMLLTSRLIEAPRAFEVGALLAVVDDAAELDAELDAVVSGLLAAAPLTLEATKQQLALISPIPSATHADDDLLRHVYSSEGFREGVRAFLAKEKPHFDRVHERLPR